MVPPFKAEFADCCGHTENTLVLGFIDQSALTASAFESSAINCSGDFGDLGLTLFFGGKFVFFNSLDALELFVLFGHALKFF